MDVQINYVKFKISSERFCFHLSDQETCGTCYGTFLRASKCISYHQSVLRSFTNRAEARSLNGSDARGSAQVSTSLVTSGDIASVHVFVMSERCVENFEAFPWLRRLDHRHRT